MLFTSSKQYLKGLSPEDREKVKDALTKLRVAQRGKGTKARALFNTIDKASTVGKAGGVTRQAGGTRRGDR